MALSLREVERHQSGRETTYAVSVHDAQGMSSIQLSLGWNPGDLELLEVKPAQPSALLESTFADESISLKPGALTFVWSDVGEPTMGLEGERTLFSLVFRAHTGSAVNPWIASLPTPVFASKGSLPIPVRFLNSSVDSGRLPAIRLRYRLDSSESGMILVEFDSENDMTYVLEYRESLTRGDWVPLTSKPGNGGLIQFGDIDSSAAQRFYQIRQFENVPVETEETW